MLYLSVQNTHVTSLKNNNNKNNNRSKIIIIIIFMSLDL